MFFESRPHVKGIASILSCRQGTRINSHAVSCPVNHDGPAVAEDQSDETDAALMRRVQLGETRCFADLIRRHQPALLRVARSRLDRAESAEDAVQETFLAAYKSRHTYSDRFGFRTWLWTILLNQCRRQAAKLARVPTVAAWSDYAAAVDEDSEATRPESTVVDAGESPLARLLSQERSAALHGLLARLTDAQADALRLRFFGALKFDEIAAAMQCTPCTAKNRVKAGLTRLAEMLAERPAHEPNPPG
jgi:RNA polymerase sigma-70 factor, ECF subfamily